jgi:hypothetical protein
MWRAGKRVRSSEMSVNLYQTVLRHIPEDRDIHTTALLLTFRISNLAENIQAVNFKLWPIITLFKRYASIAVKFFDTILVRIPSFLIKLVKLNF